MTRNSMRLAVDLAAVVDGLDPVICNTTSRRVIDLLAEQLDKLGYVKVGVDTLIGGRTVHQVTGASGQVWAQERSEQAVYEAGQECPDQPVTYQRFMVHEVTVLQEYTPHHHEWTKAVNAELWVCDCGMSYRYPPDSGRFRTHL